MMKNKLVATALVVGMLAAQTLCVYGASSTTTGTTVTTSGSSSSGNTVTTTSTPVATVTTTVASSNGSASAATTESVVASLPTEVAAVATAAVQAIDSGAMLNEVVTANVSLDNYFTLTATSAISVEKSADATAVNVPIYVPNLVGNFAQIEILFMDSETGLWTVLPLTAIDLASKTVSVDLPGSGIYTVVYKQQVIQANN